MDCCWWCMGWRIPSWNHLVKHMKWNQVKVVLIFVWRCLPALNVLVGGDMGGKYLELAKFVDATIHNKRLLPTLRLFNKTVWPAWCQKGQSIQQRNNGDQQSLFYLTISLLTDCTVLWEVNPVHSYTHTLIHIHILLAVFQQLASRCNFSCTTVLL